MNDGNHQSKQLQHVIDVQVASQAKDIPTETLFQQWVTTALQDEDKSAEVCVRVVDEEEAAELNSRWREKDGPTNVLSFPGDTHPDIEPRLLGDVIICAPVVAREADEQQKVAEHHWAHLVIHGTLHLLGYDHINDEDATIMEDRETRLLELLKIENPYN